MGVSHGRTGRRRSDSSRVQALLEIAAQGPRDFAWLDSAGQGRSFVGVCADRIIEGDDIDALATIEAAWRAEPEFVWVGRMTYEIGARALLGKDPSAGARPGLVFRRYRAAVEHDHRRLRWHGEAQAIAALRARLEVSGRAPLDRGWPWEPLRPMISPELYRERAAAILESIAAGDSYQVNLSQVLLGDWKAQPRDSQALARAVAGGYARLRRSTPAPMGALLADGDAWVLSNSPETLIDVRLGAQGQDLARTWPIKGTRPRCASALADRSAAQELQTNVKERAEHLMIVDLLRNDLGQLARPGTVSAPRCPTLVSLPTVHHLVSEVSCRLRPGWTLPSLFAAVFPGGSITGAPKRRTVEIIDSLEDHRRGVYCGAIVILEPRGVTASIPIRTGVVSRRGIELCSGGGIVADSDPEAERCETLVKARAFDA